MLSMRLSFDGNTIEEKRRMNRLVLLMREDDLYGLLSNIGVEFHFPLARPVSNNVQVIHELGLGCCHVPNLDKKRRVVRKKAHV